MEKQGKEATGREASEVRPLSSPSAKEFHRMTG